MNTTKIKFYCLLVKRGLKNIEEIPKEYQSEVKKIVKENQAE